MQLNRNNAISFLTHYVYFITIQLT